MMKDLEIAFTAKEITAFGGVSLLYKMLDNCHFKEVLSSVGLPQQGSNRGKSPEQLIYGLFTGVWCGASCYNHLDIVRFDPTLCHLMGYEKGPDHRAYQRYFNKFSQAINQRVFDSLYSWFFSELCFDNYTLDFDSTVMERFCGRSPHDRQLLAASRKHISLYELSGVSRQHAGSASGQEGGTGAHGQWLLQR